MEAYGYETRVIPGVPSFCAAAAALKTGLGEMGDSIHILPGSYESGEGLQLSGTKILMKTGKKMGQSVYVGFRIYWTWNVRLFLKTCRICNGHLLIRTR